jgi:hypothetical protein
MDGHGSEYFVFSFLFPDMEDPVQLEVEVVPEGDKPEGEDGDNTEDTMKKAAKAVSSAVSSKKVSKTNAKKIKMSTQRVPSGEKNGKPTFRYLGLIEFEDVLEIDFGSSAGKIHAYGFQGGFGGGGGGVRFKKPKGKWKRPPGQGGGGGGWRYDPRDKSKKKGKYDPWKKPDGWHPIPIPLGQRGRMIVQVAAVADSGAQGSEEVFEIPFRYNWDSPQAQLSELSRQLSAAGIVHGIGQDGALTPILHRLSGRRVVAFGVSLAGDLKTRGLDFPWITVCDLGPHGAVSGGDETAQLKEMPPVPPDDSIDMLAGLDQYRGAPPRVSDIDEVAANFVGDDAVFHTTPGCRPGAAFTPEFRNPRACQELPWMPVGPPEAEAPDATATAGERHKAPPEERAPL